MLLSRGPRCERERGAVAVEFALVFCFLLIPLTLGVIDYGWYFYSTQSTSSAARETARRLSVGDCTGANEARNFARSQSGFPGLVLDYGSTTALDNTLPSVGSTLRVKVTFDAKLVGLIPLPNGGAISKTHEARVEDSTPEGSC